MLYVTINEQGTAILARHTYPDHNSFETRNDWKDFAAAQKRADELNAATDKTRTTYIATDAGPHVSPRYDIVEVPQVGDKVSYGFNGDSYPDGEIVKVGKGHKIITTSTGSRYFRRKQTGAWIKTGGTWALRAGHVYEQNPHF